MDSDIWSQYLLESLWMSMVPPSEGPALSSISTSLAAGANKAVAERCLVCLVKRGSPKWGLAWKTDENYMKTVLQRPGANHAEPWPTYIHKSGCLMVLRLSCTKLIQADPSHRKISKTRRTVCRCRTWRTFEAGCGLQMTKVCSARDIRDVKGDGKGSGTSLHSIIERSQNHQTSPNTGWNVTNIHAITKNGLRRFW